MLQFPKVQKFLIFTGESTRVNVEQVSSMSMDSISVKRKADTISEVSVCQGSKRKVKQSQVEDNDVEINSKKVATKQKLSIKTEDISGTVKHALCSFNHYIHMLPLLT